MPDTLTIPRIPKQTDEIKTVDDIIGDLSFITKEFPFAAVKAAIDRHTQITPWLIQALQRVVENPFSVEPDRIDHLYALFLLAQFREKSAFPLVMKLSGLPEDLPETLLDDVMTENLHNIIASMYDDDLLAIQTLIETSIVCTWVRSAGMRALLTLVKEGVLDRQTVVEYFRSLFRHPTIATDEMALSHLINASCDLYAVELFDEIKHACDSGIPDPFSVDIQWISNLFKSKPSLEHELLADVAHQYGFIRDTIEIMSPWACFQDEPAIN